MSKNNFFLPLVIVILALVAIIIYNVSLNKSQLSPSDVSAATLECGQNKTVDSYGSCQQNTAPKTIWTKKSDCSDQAFYESKCKYDVSILFEDDLRSCTFAADAECAQKLQEQVTSLTCPSSNAQCPSTFNPCPKSVQSGLCHSLPVTYDPQYWEFTVSGSGNRCTFVCEYESSPGVESYGNAFVACGNCVNP